MSHAPLPPVSPPAPQHSGARGRRRFLSKLASQVMFSGILLSGVTASGIVVRYLYPRAGLSRRRLIFLAPLADIPPGTARPYTLPGGETTVVTNTGGMLCHAAVVAREYGIPAVVGTRSATETLHDGQLVEVDGDAGTVRVVP